MDTALLGAAITAALVAAGCGAVAIAAWRSMLKTGNGRIRFVVAAFSILAIKNLVKSVGLAAGVREAPFVELAFSLVDLAAVLLLAGPLLSQRGGKA